MQVSLDTVRDPNQLIRFCSTFVAIKPFDAKQNFSCFAAYELNVHVPLCVQGALF